MQIRIFSIPLPGGKELTEELNRFLRSKKILQVESQIVQDGNGAYWCFCVKYLEDISNDRPRKKVDYKEVLDKESFERFMAMREIRRKIAKDEDIPAYAVFTDNELAGVAQIKEPTLAAMKKIKGIGQKKVEKYGKFFIANSYKTDEAS